MSLADFDERDLDRLADFVAGELPASAAAEVERLVRTDPAWSQAYAELAGADARIQIMLHDEGRTPVGPMPADVIARVDAALESASRATVISLDAVRRRRRRQWLNAAAAVVVGIGLCTGVVTVIRNGSQTMATNSGNAAGLAAPHAGNDDSLAGPPGTKSEPAAPAPAPTPTRLYTVTSSGLNYTATTLRLADVRGGLNYGTRGQPENAPVPSTSPAGSVSGLDACLAQVTAIHPGTIVSVDYARYESQPAIIIVIERASGAIVVAVGSQCGISGPDELAAVAG
jgi:anti-sigma factor RsiW